MDCLLPPPSNRPYRLLALDPGSDTCGMAVAELDFVTNTIHFVFVTTVECSKLARHAKHITEIHGDKVGRLWALQEEVYSMLVGWEIDGVASEAPFSGRFATAYAALVECIKVIRTAIAKYDWNMPLNLYDPPSVKVSVGAPGKSKDKTLVSKGIKTLPFVKWSSNIDFDALDEHSTDAMAVAIKHARTILEIE